MSLPRFFRCWKKTQDSWVTRKAEDNIILLRVLQNHSEHQLGPVEAVVCHQWRNLRAQGPPLLQQSVSNTALWWEGDQVHLRTTWWVPVMSSHFSELEVHKQSAEEACRKEQSRPWPHQNCKTPGSLFWRMCLEWGLKQILL